MSNIEEQLWAYIDGTCTAAEHQTISLLIEQDAAWREKYHELLAFNTEITAMELDEPPMAFTYDVMESIRTENAKQPLKAAINTTVIKLIGGFFVFTILAIFVFIFANINWAATGNTGINLPAKLPDYSGLAKTVLFKGFMFFDVVLALFLFDGFLRRRNASKHA